MNKMKRILTIVLTLALIVTMMPMNLTNVNAKSTTRLSSKKIVLQVGKTKKLKVKNKPAGVKVVWKSSKKKVATVSKKGKVKAKKPGKTTITAKVGKKKYKCKVIVKRKNSIKVTKPSDNNNSVINQVTTKSEPSQIVTTKAEVKTTKTETTKKNDSTTVKPTVAPTTVAPTAKPTVAPTTAKPTVAPTTVAPTLKPTVKPTTVAPTTVAPTTVAPTLKPTAKPTTVAPTTANGNVDESIKAPEGLVHAPGEGLPYHFAWAAVDGADGYNVYIDGVYVTKVTENVADLDASMFTKGAGEYTVGVATVKENKTSAITSIKYTYAGSGQPATTKVSVTTTVAPVATTVAPVITTVAPVTTPSVPGQDVDESIKAPEGLVWAGNANLPYYFAWAKADGIDSYNVYVDGTLVANVVDGSVNLNESVFTKGSGEYAIGIAAVKGNKTSVITSIKYTYAGSGQPATTKAPEPSTAKPTDVTVAPTAPGQDVDESIKAPEGLVWAGNANLPYYFAWAPVVGVDSYNVYVDGVYATNVNGNSVNLEKSVFTKGSGEYTVGVAAVKGNKVSNITSVKYTYTGDGAITTTKAPEAQPTAAPTTVAPTAKPTVAPTTVAPTTKAISTTAVPTTVKKTTVKKTTVKATAKKLSSNKVKLSVKKVAGASKYAVQISTTKNFKKVVAKKTSKKAVFTVKSKKLKGKKKLYVRVKVYKKVNGKTVASQWSKATKIRLKK